MYSRHGYRDLRVEIPGYHHGSYSQGSTKVRVKENTDHLKSPGKLNEIRFIYLSCTVKANYRKRKDESLLSLIFITVRLSVPLLSSFDKPQPSWFSDVVCLSVFTKISKGK